MPLYTYMHAHYIKGENTSQWTEHAEILHIQRPLFYHIGRSWCSVVLPVLAKVPSHSR